MEIMAPSSSAPLEADPNQMCQGLAALARAPKPHPVHSSHPDILSYVDEEDVRVTNDDAAAASSRWLSV